MLVNQYFRRLVRIVFLLALLPCVTQAQNPARNVRHSTLPTDANYWEYNKWYLSHAVVDVFIRGTEAAHLEQALTEVAELKKRNVLFRRIVVIGGNSFSHLDASSRARLTANPQGEAAKAVYAQLQLSPRLLPLAKELALGNGAPLADAEGELRAEGIKVSPTWIIHSKGQRYIFEGVHSLTKQFSRTGEFREGEEKRVKQADTPLFYPADSKNVAPSPAIAYAYRSTDLEPPPGAGTYDVKPDCIKSTIRRVPVLYPSEELNEFDLTYYNYHDAAEVERAKRASTPTVPYLEGDTFNPWRVTPNIPQELGRVFDIRCLPTRVHFTADPDKPGAIVEEYREGEAAW